MRNLAIPRNLWNITFNVVYADKFIICGIESGTSDEDSLLIAGLDYTEIVVDNKRVKFSNLKKYLRLYTGSYYYVVKDILYVKQNNLVPFYIAKPFMEIGEFRIFGPFRANLEITEDKTEEYEIANLKISFEKKFNLLKVLDTNFAVNQQII
jgi:hypothetical protein